MVIYREIRPPAALYPPPPHIQKKSFIVLRSQWSPGVVCCLRHLHPFLLYQSKKILWGGYNIAKGLISWDIAKSYCNKY